MTGQERADTAETAAIRRYVAMRGAWGVAWGRAAQRELKQAQKRLAGHRRAG